MKSKLLLDKIKASGYKVTAQRKAIIDVLASHQTHLISVDTILQESKKLSDKINVTTIYRNLEVMQAHNIIRKAMGDDGTALYQLICKSEHHHHLVCILCGKTEIVDFCPMEMFNQVADTREFIITSHVLELYGYCKDCRNQVTQSNLD